MTEFDEYIKNGKMVCYQFAQEILKLKKQGVRFYFFRLPVVNDLKNPSELEQKIIKENINGDNVLDLITKKEMEQVMGCPYSEDYVKGVFRSFEPIVRKNGVLVHNDSKHTYFNVMNGCRITTDQPDIYENTIYLYGKSQCFGLGVSDEETIASCLQRKCKPKYYVENHGVGGVSYQEILFHVQYGEFKSGDVVIVLQHIEEFMNACYAEIGVKIDNTLFDILSRPHNMGEIFFDRYHFNQIACNTIAKYVKSVIDKSQFEHIVDQEKVLKAIAKTGDIIGPNEEILDSNDFKEYIEKVNRVTGKLDGHIGAIVMNCNPFTFGHRYLIEYAIQKVDNLLIFVVEEDSSFFSFEDRFNMVKAGCSDLKNIYIIPSGKFIISAQTFPQYFKKDSMKEVTIDPSNDVYIFAKYIAPLFKIKSRFVGKEPFDFITRQYNEKLLKILPEFGIDLVVIERAEFEGDVISASLVRKYMEEGDLKNLEHLIPDTTLKYCMKKQLL